MGVGVQVEGWTRVSQVAVGHVAAAVVCSVCVWWWTAGQRGGHLKVQ